MKTKYETVEFQKFENDWYCLCERGKIGLVYYGPITSQWYYNAASDTGHTADQLRDITDFLDQLNKIESEESS